MLECCCTCNPSERGYMKDVGPVDSPTPTSRLTSKRLVAQCSNIHRKRLLSEPGRQVRGGSSSPHSETGYRALRTAARAADLVNRRVLREGFSNLHELSKCFIYLFTHIHTSTSTSKSFLSNIHTLINTSGIFPNDTLAMQTGRGPELEGQTETIQVGNFCFYCI